MTMTLDDKQEQMLIELLTMLNVQCEPMRRGARDGATMGFISIAISKAKELDYVLFVDPDAPYDDTPTNHGSN